MGVKTRHVQGELIPSEADLRCGGGPDEKYVVKHFCGKTLEEAADMFAKNAEFYTGDFLWMGVKGYFYYIHAIKKYLHSDEGKYHMQVYSETLGYMKLRMEQEPEFRAAFAEHREEILGILQLIKTNLEDYIANHDEDEEYLFSIYHEIPGMLSECIAYCNADTPSDMVCPSPKS